MTRLVPEETGGLLAPGGPESPSLHRVTGRC